MAPPGDAGTPNGAGSAFTPVAAGSRPRLLGKSFTAVGHALEGVSLSRGRGSIVAPLSSLLEAAGPCVEVEMDRFTESISWLYDAVKTLEERGTGLASQLKRVEGTLESCLESMVSGDLTLQGTAAEEGPTSGGAPRYASGGDGASPEVRASSAEKDFRRLLRQQDHKRVAEHRIFEMKLDSLKAELLAYPSSRDLEALKVTVQEKVDAAEQRIREDVSMLGGLLNEEGAADRRRMLSQFEAFQKRQDKQFELSQDKLKELVGQGLQPLADRLSAQEVLDLRVEALEERLPAVVLSPPGTAAAAAAAAAAASGDAPAPMPASECELEGAEARVDAVEVRGGEPSTAEAEEGKEVAGSEGSVARRLNILEARLQALIASAAPAASSTSRDVSGVASARASLSSVPGGSGSGSVAIAAASEGGPGAVAGPAPTDGASPGSPASPASPAGFGAAAAGLPLESTAQFGGTLAWSSGGREGGGASGACPPGPPVGPISPGAAGELSMTLGGGVGAAGEAAAAGLQGLPLAIQELFARVDSRLARLEATKDEAALPELPELPGGEDASSPAARPMTTASEATCNDQASQQFQTEESGASRSGSRNAPDRRDRDGDGDGDGDGDEGNRRGQGLADDSTPKGKSPRAPRGLGDAIHEGEDHGAQQGPRRSPVKRKDRGSAAERGGRSGRPNKAGDQAFSEAPSQDEGSATASPSLGGAAVAHRPPPSRHGARGRGRSPNGQAEDRIAELEAQLEEMKRQEAHKQRSQADNVNRLRRSVELLAKYVVGHQGESSPTNDDPLMWLEKTRHDRLVQSVDMRLRELEGNADSGGSVKERVKKVEHEMGTMDLEYLRQVKPELQNFKDEQEAVQSDLHREVKELKVLVGCLEACIPQDTRKAVQLFKRAAGIDGHQEGPKTAIQLQLEGKILSLQEELETRLKKAETKIDGQCERVSTVVRDLERKQERFDNHLAIVTEKVGGTTWRASATSGQPSPRSSCTPVSDATRGTRRNICRASTPDIPQGAVSSASLAIPHRSTSEATSEGPDSLGAQSVAERIGAAGWTKSASSIPPTPTPPKTS